MLELAYSGDQGFWHTTVDKLALLLLWSLIYSSSNYQLFGIKPEIECKKPSYENDHRVISNLKDVILL